MRSRSKLTDKSLNNSIQETPVIGKETSGSGTEITNLEKVAALNQNSGEIKNDPIITKDEKEP